MGASTGNPITDNLNFIRMLSDGLERRVKKHLTEELVNKELAEYEKKLRGIIEPMVNDISFESINKIQDFQQIRDELRLCIKWKDKDPEYRDFDDSKLR